MAALMVFATVGYAQTTYTKVTSASGLEAGANYLIVAHYDDLGVLAMGMQNSNNRKAVAVSENGESITVTPGTDPSSSTDVFQFTLGGSANAWTFFDEVKGGYLYAAGGGDNNYLKTQETLDANGQWSITFNADGTAEVIAQGDATRNNMRFNPNANNNNPLFSCYLSTTNIETRVSFYKAGAPVISPEPTNYPTNFAAVVSGTNVTLTWTDATGAQLPSKYLVRMSTGTIAVPTDGNPVANSDVDKNVNYGVQSVSFNGLEGSTTYNFAIFPYTNAGDNIDYKTDGSYPTAQATTEQIVMLLDEGFDSGLGVFTAENVLGEQVWTQASYNNVTYADMNGYTDGAHHANEDWLISPVMPVGRDNIALEFKTAKKFDGNPLLVKVSCDYVAGASVSTATWTDVTDRFNFSTGNFEWVESGQVSISDCLNNASNFTIAFVYSSTDEASSHWEIDYVKVIKGASASVAEQEFAVLSVYPNPANNMVSFNLVNDAQVSIFDITGRMVSTMNMAAGQGQCQVGNLENGVYFLNVRYADGKMEIARFVKF